MTWGTQIIGNGVSLLLAVILGPKDFGTVAIAFIFLSFLQVLMSQGMEDTLVQRQDLLDSHLNSAFWYLCGSGTLLMLVAMLLSGWWAAMNHQPGIGIVLQVLSVKILVYSLLIVQRAVLVRRMGFKALALQWNLSEFAAGLIGVSMAAGGAGLWALVGQQLTRDVIALGLLWNIGKWRPKLQFSWKHLKELFPFAGPTFAAEFGTYVRSQVDTMVVGLFFGPTAVGLYRLADRIRETMVILVSRTLQWVSLPNLARLQDDPIALKNAYLGLLKLSVAATLPLMLSFCFSSDLLVGVLGAKWVGASRVISTLCIMGSFEGLTILTTPLLQARSRPLIVAMLVWVFGITNVVLTTLCASSLRHADVSWQVNGMAYCKLAAFSLAFLPVNMLFAKRTSGATVREFLRAVLPGIVAAMSAVSVLFLCKMVVLHRQLPELVKLAATLTFSLSAAASAVLLIERDWRVQLIKMVSSRISSRKSAPAELEGKSDRIAAPVARTEVVRQFESVSGGMETEL